MTTGDQAGYEVRFEWGPTGGALVAADAAAIVVVDVLSFTTAVTVAAERGTAVIPYPSSGPAAETVAAQHGAGLAGPRSLDRPSLSPTSLRDATELPARLVLPSPNGSAVADALRGGAPIAAASFRNVSAVASWAADRRVVAVVAAGERWPDGSLRPALEDLWAAGAVLAQLEDDGAHLSPEAVAAADAHRLIAGREGGHLRACASGVELIDRGFELDVDLAAEVDATRLVPVLGADGFTPDS